MESDEEFLQGLIEKAKPEMQYHDICLWLPHKPETVADIADDIKKNGYRADRPVVVYEGKILDGRHRYEAAVSANVDPVFVEFQGTKEEAIAFVASENVNRRHLSSPEKEFFYVQLANTLGVQQRGGDRGNQYQSGNVTNVTMAPSQEDHANTLGVRRETVNRWEQDRKEIMSDPTLANRVKNAYDYRQVKRELNQRRKATEEEARRIRSLKDRAASTTSDSERDAVQNKLDKYREQGVDVDAVVDQKQEDEEREQYFTEKQQRDAAAYRIADHLLAVGDRGTIKSLILHAYPSITDLQQAEKLYIEGA